MGNLDPQALVGEVVAESYLVLSLTGAGLTGTVYKAKQSQLDRFVALKVLHRLWNADKGLLERFQREAKLISSFSHANIVGFYSYGFLEDNMPYIAMEWLEGLGLDQLIKSEKTLSPDRAIKISLQIADALGYAHRAGVIHRDLKPANVFLIAGYPQDYVKVIDFGLARAEEFSHLGQRLTATGAMVGTPHYLSPEQIRSGAIDARADVYSLGCTLFEMLCGKVPFNDENPMNVIQKHIHDDPTNPSEVTGQVLPEGLDQVVLKCLQKNPSDRYQDMDELQSDLREILDGSGEGVRARSTAKRQGWEWHWTFAAIGFLISFAAAFYAWLTLTDQGQLAYCMLILDLPHEQKTVFECQRIADELEAKGKMEMANRICIQISQKIEVSTYGLKNCKLQLGLARLALAEKNEQAASTYAWSVMTKLFAGLNNSGSKLGFVGGSVDDTSKIADQAAAVLLKLPAVKTRQQADLVLRLYFGIERRLPEMSCDHLFELMAGYLSPALLNKNHLEESCGDLQIEYYKHWVKAIADGTMDHNSFRRLSKSLNLARLLLSSGYYPEAYKFAGQCLLLSYKMKYESRNATELLQTRAEAAILVAEVCEQMKRFEEALTNLREEISGQQAILRGHSPPPTAQQWNMLHNLYHELGIIYEKRGDTEKSRECNLNLNDLNRNVP